LPHEERTPSVAVRAATAVTVVKIFREIFTTATMHILTGDVRLPAPSFWIPATDDT
jgi:hypothetical protein